MEKQRPHFNPPPPATWRKPVGILALLAARSSPSRIEREALAVRRQAINRATSALAFSTLAAQLLRLLTSLVSRRRPRS